MSITIALAGNPNSGKTTLFNTLTGANQFVGNWPGVTVEKKEGKLKGHKDVTITDLPGIYSLSPYTLEEVVARNYIINQHPDVILNIIDGTNIERNLYLSTQLIELGIPVVMAVNMMDIVKKNGDVINLKNLSECLGCPVVEISALKGKGVKEAAEKAVLTAKNHFSSEIVHRFSPSVEQALEEIEDSIYGVAEEQKRFCAVKLFERDDKIKEVMSSVPDVESIIVRVENESDDDAESIITNERYNYITSIIGKCYVKKNKSGLTTSDKIDKVVTNRFLALPIFAVVMFIVYYVSVSTVGGWATDWANDGLFSDGWHLLGIGSSKYEDAAEEYEESNAGPIVEAFYAAAQENGAVDTDKSTDEETVLLEDKAQVITTEAEIYDEEGNLTKTIFVDFNKFKEASKIEEPDPSDYGVWVPGIPGIIETGLDKLNCADWLKGLIIDGIIGGVGAVLGFVPQMLVLFIFLAFLESCGYMARVAFFMDRIFRKFGLSGKSFIPMLIGTGCGIPGIMASRTIESERDRRMTIMTTTFIPCGAKLPIIALIAGALFDNAGWVAVSAYFIGVAAIIISGIMLKKTKMFSGDPAPFVMELPAYHLPTVGNVLRSMWERAWSFIKKAGTIILLSAIVLWFLQAFGWSGGEFGMVEYEDSILNYIGKGIAWIFAPLGWGRSEAAVATITGLIAKENVVGTFGVLFGGFDEVAENGWEIWTNMREVFTPLAAYSFLIFNLLCAPCFAAMGAIKREMSNGRWTAFAIGYQCLFAYSVSLIVFQIGSIFTGSINVLGLIFAVILLALMIYMLFKPYKESNRLAKKIKVAAK